MMLSIILSIIQSNFVDTYFHILLYFSFLHIFIRWIHEVSRQTQRKYPD